MLFDDDHTSTGTLDSGNYLTTTFEGENVAGGHEIRISHAGSYTGAPATRTYTFVIPGYTKPVKSVSVSDSELLQAATRADFDAAADNAWFLDSDNTLYLRKSLPTNGNATIAVNANETGSLNRVEALDGAVFDYSPVTGLYSYSLPAGTTDARLTVVSMSGSVVAELPLDSSASSIRQVAVPTLSTGIYLSILSAHTSGGTMSKLTIKTPVR